MIYKCSHELFQAKNISQTTMPKNFIITIISKSSFNIFLKKDLKKDR